MVLVGGFGFGVNNDRGGARSFGFGRSMRGGLGEVRSPPNHP